MSVDLYQQLQRLSTLQDLMRRLTDGLGAPPPGESSGYKPVAKMILGAFEKAVAALDRIHNNSNLNSHEIHPGEQQQELFAASARPGTSAEATTLRPLFSLILNSPDDDAASALAESITWREVADAVKKQQERQAAAAAQDAEEEDLLLPPEVEQSCFDLLFTRLRRANLRQAVARGAQVLLRIAATEMAEAELRKEEQREREQRARAIAYHNELRRLGGGAAAASSLSGGQRGGGVADADADFGLGIDLNVMAMRAEEHLDTDDATHQQQQHHPHVVEQQHIEIERCDREPDFLRAMGVNFRERLLVAERELRRQQLEQQKDKQQRQLGGGGARSAAAAASSSALAAAAASAANANKTSLELALERREAQLKAQREMDRQNGIINPNSISGNDNTANASGSAAGGASATANTNMNNKFMHDLGESANTETGIYIGGLQQLQQQQELFASTNEETRRAKIAAQRANLPIAAYKQHIIDTIRSQRATILSAETGSGKTTQVPQYLLEAGFHRVAVASSNNNSNTKPSSTTTTITKLIACTQPRLIAAKTVAQRVAEEYGCTACGEEVGYTVRFDDCTSPRTLLKYMTDGVLLREALLDDSFSRYAVIVLDEAHERNLNTDILFALCRAALSKNPDLRLVVTSATLDVERFATYFGCERRLDIPGRTFPVERVFLKEPCEDYFEQALKMVMTIHETERPGDILVFLTGRDEIENARRRLERWLDSEEAREKMPPLVVTRLYAGLPDDEKARALAPAPGAPLARKVVLSTNIAETSVTIDGLYYVVDCGYCKENIYNAKTRVDTLAVVPIAQSQAKQRCGRAGRTGPGKCFFLYTEAQFWREMKPATTPEIQRTNLASVVLTLKAIGVHDLLSLEFMDPPPREALVAALEQLYFLSALDGDGVLTRLGSRMSQLPVSPNESRTLLAAMDLGCLDPVVTIVAMLGEQHVFHRPRDFTEQADQARLSFTAAEGDHITLLRVYEAWAEAEFDKQWCRNNFVNPAAMQRCKDLRTQLHGILKFRGGGEHEQQQHHQLNTVKRTAEEEIMTAAGVQRSFDLVSVRKAFVAGQFYHAAKRSNGSDYISLADKRQVSLHPTSALFHIQPTYCLWHTLQETTKEYMREAIAVDPAWLLEMAPNFFSSPGAGKMTKAQQAARLDPILKQSEAHAGPNTWRISKLRSTQTAKFGRR